jgi:hypothetical protein
MSHSVQTSYEVSGDPDYSVLFEKGIFICLQGNTCTVQMSSDHEDFVRRFFTGEVEEKSEDLLTPSES